MTRVPCTDGYNVARVQWVVDVDTPLPSGTKAVASGTSAVDSGPSAVDSGHEGAGSMAAAVESGVGGGGGDDRSKVVSAYEYEGGDLGGNALQVEHQRYQNSWPNVLLTCC